MKTTISKLFFTLFFLLIMGYSFAQAPKAFNYQAVARDVSGNVIDNQLLGIKISLHKTTATGAIVYSETFAPTTNNFGLFTLSIGTGTLVTGLFDTIAWGVNKYWLQVEMDPTGGTTYSNMGTSQLLTVPYAMYAERTPAIGFSAWSSAVQSLTGSSAIVAFDTEEYDDGNNFASNGFTAPRDGVYHFDAHVRLNGNTTAGVYCWLAFYVNSNNKKTSTTQTGIDKWGISNSADLKLHAGEVVTVHYYGPALSTADASVMNTWFMGHLVY